MTESLSMNQQTRKRRMIEFLVSQEEPTSVEEAAALMDEWDQRDYQAVREAHRYNKEHGRDRSK
jgi:hypothetical protein